MDIRFEFEGEVYHADVEGPTTSGELVELPDERVVWFTWEGDPPTPTNFEVHQIPKARLVSEVEVILQIPQGWLADEITTIRKLLRYRFGKIIASVEALQDGTWQLILTKPGKHVEEVGTFLSKGCGFVILQSTERTSQS